MPFQGLHQPLPVPCWAVVLHNIARPGAPNLTQAPCTEKAQVNKSKLSHPGRRFPHLCTIPSPRRSLRPSMRGSDMCSIHGIRTLLNSHSG